MKTRPSLTGYHPKTCLARATRGCIELHNNVLVGAKWPSAGAPWALAYACKKYSFRQLPALLSLTKCYVGLHLSLGLYSCKLMMSMLGIF